MNNQKLLSQIVDNLHVVISVMDKNLKFLFVNKEYEKIIQTDKKDIIGKTIQELLGEEFYEEVKPYKERTLKGESLDFEMTKEYKGTIFTLRNFYVPLYDEFDEIDGIIHLSVDITDRKKIQKELIKAKEFSENLIETSNAIVIGVDTKGIINIFNKTAETITGYSKEEIIGQNWFELITPIEALPQVWEEFNRQLKDDSTQKQFENPIFTKDGGSRDILWQSNNLYENGEVVGLVSFGIDITDRKRMENELIQAKEKAEQSDKLKSAFLANMSHEIRTPLNGLMGFSQLLVDPDLSDVDKKKYIKIINSSSNQLMNIINDVLDISKIEVGQVTIFKTEVCINDLINYVTSFKILGKEDIQIFIDTPLSDDESIIITDEPKMKQILTNLINNAFKFTHFGSIHIGYQLENGFLKFYVKDTGIGISKDKLEIIFDRFRQAEEGLSRTYGGTGLGLSICKAFVDMLGGKIWVESKEGEGSTFYFTTPYDSKFKKEKITMNNDLILVVEDNEDIFLYIQTLLKRKNINYIHAENGKKCLEFFNEYKNNIKMILMDIRLPDITGYELIRTILDDKKIPIVAQSAYAFSEERERAMKLGCVDYITKPIREESFNKILNKYFFNEKN